MKISIKNLTNNAISCDAFSLTAGQSNVVDVPDADLQATVAQLALLGSKVQYTISSVSSADVSAPLAMYVATTGLDTNPGTNEAPFKTVQAALDAVPKKIKSAVVINIAAGIYTNNITISNFIFDGGTGSLSILGPDVWDLATLSTGAATGTVTSYAAPVSATPALGTLTDTGQAWTVNALKGLFVTITSGALTGVRKVIVSNTATALDIGVSLGAVTAGMTYSIEKPAAVLAGFFSIIGNSGACSAVGITVQNVEIQSTSSTPVIPGATSLVYITRNSLMNVSSLILRQLRIILLHPNIFALRVESSSVTLTSTTPGTAYVAFEGTGSGFGASVADNGLLTLQGTYVRVNSATTGGDVVRVTGPATLGATFGSSVVEGAGSSSNPIMFLLGSSGVACAKISGTHLRGTAARALIGVGDKVSGLFPSYLSLSAAQLTTGAVGVLVSANSAVTIYSGLGVPSFTAVTNELQIDGVNSTYAAFIALTPKKIVGDTGSLISQYS